MNNNNINYSSLISNGHENCSSSESLRIYDSSYNPYSSHSIPYSDYATPPSKIEPFEYNYWSTPATTHNILTNPSLTILDPTCSNSTLENLVPVSSVQLSQKNSSISNHHHSHQHVYPLPPSSPPSACNDPGGWLGSGNYQALHSTPNSSSYRHYPNACSFYAPNNFYDSPQSQWTSPPAGQVPFKFEQSYTPTYFDTANHLNHCQQQTPKDELSNSSQQSDWLKSESSSTKLIPVPPKNPLNGNSLTFNIKE